MYNNIFHRVIIEFQLTICCKIQFNENQVLGGGTKHSYIALSPTGGLGIRV